MERLSGFFQRRPKPPPAASPDDPLFSVLDVGDSSVKAVIAQADESGATFLAYAAIPLRGDRVAACERALVAAEDTAGVVPRRVVLTLPAPGCIVAMGSAEERRGRAVAPLTEPELDALLQRGEREALTAARRMAAADRGASGRIETLHVVPQEMRVDGRAVPAAAGQPGERVQARVAVVCAPDDDVAGATRTAEALDLELAALIAPPFALGAALRGREEGPALTVDVGARGTSIVASGPFGAEGSAWLPVGGAALEERLQERLGIDAQQAVDAVLAHAAGAGRRSSAGPAAGRATALLAQHHADVWLDAFEAACAELGRGRTLPARVLLCGGGAALPELRRALGGSAWHSALPFERPPAVRPFLPADLAGTTLPDSFEAGPEAVPPLAAAAAHAMQIGRAF